MTDRHAMLDLDSRRRVYRHIERNPGLHLRGLQRALDIPLGTLEYHLHQMERTGLLTIRDDGRYKAYFANDPGLDRRDKDILYYVRQEVPRQIVMNLLLEPGLNHATLTDRLPIGASTCSFHLKKLVAANIVSEERAGRTKRFRVADPDRTANVLVRYRRSFLDALVDRFASAWFDIGRDQIPTVSAGDAKGLEAIPDPTPERLEAVDAFARERGQDTEEDADDNDTVALTTTMRHMLRLIGRLWRRWTLRNTVTKRRRVAVPMPMPIH